MLHLCVDFSKPGSHFAPSPFASLFEIRGAQDPFAGASVLIFCMTSSNSGGAEQAGLHDTLQAQAASVLSQPCVQDLAASACGQQLKSAVACFANTREGGLTSRDYPVRPSSIVCAIEHACQLATATRVRQHACRINIVLRCSRP